MRQLYYVSIFLQILSCIWSFKDNSTTTTATTFTPRQKETPHVKDSEYSFIASTVTNFYFYSVKPGSSILLDCRVNQEEQQPNITWTKDGEAISQKIFRFFYIVDIHKRFSLQFDEILTTEAGEYKCEVGNNNEKKISKRFNVEVKEPLDHQKLTVTSLTAVSLLVVGTDVKFTCVAKGDSYLPKSFRWDILIPANNTKPLNSISTWEKDGLLYKVKTLKTEMCSDGQSNLTIKEASFDLHQSILTCVAFNKKRYDRKTLSLMLKEDTSLEDGHGAPATIIIVVLIIGCIFIIAAVVYIIRRCKLKHKRKRTHSYHYASQSD